MAEASFVGRYGVKRAIINFATAATHQIVAAVPGKKIVVLNYFVKALNAQSLTWVRGTSTALSGVIAMATSDLVLTASDHGIGVLETGVNERLAITLAAATQVSGHLSYIEV